MGLSLRDLSPSLRKCTWIDGIGCPAVSASAGGRPADCHTQDDSRILHDHKETVNLTSHGARNSDKETTGRIHVLEMGQPLQIYDLEQMVDEMDFAQRLTLRLKSRGSVLEKKHEELLHDNEALLATSNPGLLLAEPRTGDIETLRKAIDQLTESARNRRREKDIESASSFNYRIAAEETAKGGDHLASNPMPG